MCRAGLKISAGISECLNKIKMSTAGDMCRNVAVKRNIVNEEKSEAHRALKCIVIAQ